MKDAITSVVVSDIQDSLQRGVDEIAEQAIAAYRLTYRRKATESLNEPLLRWLDFALRYIPPIPRSILKSDKFPMSLPAGAETGLRRILHLLQTGGDVNPYQGKRLSHGHDTSGAWNAQRTDGLWADWNIHHLHLSEKAVAPGQRYSDRSGWLLFLAVFHNAALLIDVRRHDDDNVFSLRELVETFIRTWPEAVEPFRLNRIVGIAREQAPTDAEHARLRDGGVISPLEVGGKVYFPPGMGLSSAVTAARVGDACDRIYHNTCRLAEEVAHPDSQFMVSMRELNIAS
jgi:hypothetical protein